MPTVINVTLRKSHIGRPAAHRAVLNGLGLTKINKTVSLTDTPEVRGMIRKVSHLVSVAE
jgi:large subunit ribosomal protein L30